MVGAIYIAHMDFFKWIFDKGGFCVRCFVSLWFCSESGVLSLTWRVATLSVPYSRLTHSKWVFIGIRSLGFDSESLFRLIPVGLFVLYTDTVQSMTSASSRIHKVFKVFNYFRYATPYHYDYQLLTEEKSRTDNGCLLGRVYSVNRMPKM